MQDEDEALVQSALNLLSEHFDTVQIFATRHEAGQEGGTVAVNMGIGNWFARIGYVRQWLLENDRETSQKVVIND